MKAFYCWAVLTFFSIAFAQSPVPAGAKLVKIAGGLQFVEGPVWVDSLGLLFSDIQANKIYRWNSTDSISVFMSHSDSSNGLTLDKQGRLVLTQMELRRVSRLEKDGSITVLASGYNGKKFNCPNDIVVKSDGTVFFTDPNFNVPAGQKQELSFQGVYRIGPHGNLQLVDSTLALPNGICFSPDEKKLYVNDSQVRKIYVWDIVDDSVLTNKRVFASISKTGYADGMKMDSSGNLFCAGPDGIWVFSPSGAQVDKIVIPDQSSASNCNWGDSDRKTLYITANTGLYKIRLASATGVKQNEGMINKSFKLYQNYPNPFNPSTIISWSLEKSSKVKLTIYDLLGNEVTVLADEFQNAGVHSAAFNIDNINKKLSSGAYFYELKINSNALVKKMMMLK